MLGVAAVTPFDSVRLFPLQHPLILKILAMHSAIKETLAGMVKGLAPNLVHYHQTTTWAERSLPHFIILGAQKAGTTSLHEYLSQHPQLVPSLKKEVHFFDGGTNPKIDTFAKGLPWYRAHFPLEKHLEDGKKTFESSPLYLFHPRVPQRIAEMLPTVKMIVLLRNPSKRAISHYFHEKRKGREPLPMYEAFTQEEHRLEPVLKTADYNSHAFIHYSYKGRGLYWQQLERYFQYFTRDQVLILASEELFRRTEACLRTVFEFIGVDPAYKVANLQPKNVANNRTAVPSKVYDDLDEFFKPHNEKLYQLLGQDFGW